MLNDNNVASNLCPVCFAQTGGAEVCPVCGYDYNVRLEEDWNKITPGTVIHDRYLIGKCLGQGGFGITYLGLDLRLNVKLAIKEYYPTGVAVRNNTEKTVISATRDTQADFQAGLDKFLEEARTLAMFENHPNIVSVKDFFEYNGTAYMVMSYLEGDTLLSYLKSHGNKISFEEAYMFLAPIMDALDTVHASGLIHRDISPDNVFITNDGQVRLLDFGAAKSAMALMNQQNHSIVLKKGYSPAEQYQENGALGPWTDIYSMAATFYRCIMGFIPQDSIDRLIEDKLQLPSQNGVIIPNEAENAILKALSIQPSARFQSMGDFKDALKGRAEDAHHTIVDPGVYKKAVEVNNATSHPSPGANNNIARQIQAEGIVEQPSSGKSNKKLFISIAAAVAIVLVGVSVAFVSTRGAKEEDFVVSEQETDNSEFAIIKRKAKHGDKEAQYKLGTYYQQGKKGLNQDYKSAANWFKKSAEQGYAPAQNAIGMMYEGGYGVPQNYKEAAAWLTKAADQGDPYAQSNLAMLYRNGQGVPENIQKAFELYKLAADQGEVNGQAMLGYLYAEGFEGQQKNLKLSAKYYELAAKQGNANAQYMIGMYYEYGGGVPKDHAKAVQYLQKAAEQGHEEASTTLKAIRQ